ncbi:DUF3493 domain-containing protein [Aerosakkonemataceae cyanobacterium BLCC-F154]|uniref:DUF3493 domain-containing protein n=1 Tax=Floridaenema fluviatile BLCC-F154 TaxID=3153640 RepID=A0ABV4YDM1_9CYAN
MNTPKPPTPEKYARLKEEIKAPYRGLRQFIYLAFGASGLIGAVVFLSQLAAGQEVESALPNFALQVGILALMIWLFRLEQRASRKSQTKKAKRDL